MVVVEFNYIYSNTQGAFQPLQVMQRNLLDHVTKVHSVLGPKVPQYELRTFGTALPAMSAVNTAAVPDI